jgi:hypothetical protein
MHHLVQRTPSNDSPPTETVSLLPAPQSLLEMGRRHSNLEDPLPSPHFFLSRRQSLPSNLSNFPVQNSMSHSPSVIPSASPHSFPGGAPPCLANLWITSQTVLEVELSFALSFKIIKTYLILKILSKLFLLKTFPPRRPLSLWKPTNSNKRKKPP